MSESSGLAGQLINKFKPAGGAARSRVTFFSYRPRSGSESFEPVWPSVVESLKQARISLSSSKKQEIKIYGGELLGLKKVT
jgi:hypothetical protein